MKISLLLSVCVMSLYGMDSFGAWFQEGDISGTIRYYYIETNKKWITNKQTSAYANSVGGQLKYSTADWNGWKLGTNLITTQAFLLPHDVESSAIGQDNGFMGKDPAKSFSIIGEAYIDYQDDLFNAWYGRRGINTPMIGEKDVRMLPSTVQGAEGRVFLGDTTTFSLSYLDRFKQRSSNEFTNIIEHALGEDTRSITGEDGGYVLPVMMTYHDDRLTINLYDLYASNFINTAYIDIAYKEDFYTLSSQAVVQNSIGNASANLAKETSVTEGKKIHASGIGVRGEINYKESSWDLVFRKIFRNSSTYDSLITPWDGTLLYAYSSATNNLGQSFYGNALTSGGAYVGGTQGFKLGYTQKYDFAHLKGFSTHAAYARYLNPLYREDQEDIKLILAYKQNNWSLQLKGIWIDNDTYTNKDGTINQLDRLIQYHVIANYTF